MNLLSEYHYSCECDSLETCMDKLLKRHSKEEIELAFNKLLETWDNSYEYSFKGFVDKINAGMRSHCLSSGGEYLFREFKRILGEE